MATVLAVEDDPDARALLESWLQWMGHDVVSAVSVAEAESLVEGIGADPAAALDVAVLDIAMPDGSGLEVLQRLRQQPATARVPAIFLSASELDTDRAAARTLGAHFIAKPIKRSVLQAAVDAALSRHA